ncbi:phosphatase PAP2 family protein [Roseobacter weihaiensis]|uniref:phosphatase PAP2 family protein n=1 Tax=Roseobacter weihaiensis TaxID=2763262 RepID=UPI001D0AAFCD|nr:phosphatase PAP2 family protein [Roseobacter sp. H9]
MRRYYSLLIVLDQRIRFEPVWVWIYTVAYYPFILSLVFMVSNWREYTYIASSFFFMLALQATIAMIFPVKTPFEWREYHLETISRRLLSVVQRIDRGGNCFPSMHVSVAVLSAMHMHMIWDVTITVSAVIWLFPALVSLSTIYTKQHFVLDVPAGVLHAVVCFVAFDNIFQKLTVA